jgi:hypothetical protein
MPIPPDVPPPDTLEPEEVKYGAFIRDTTLDPQMRRYYEYAEQVCVFVHLFYGVDRRVG